jgi:uncharacterized protein with GYD domain
MRRQHRLTPKQTVCRVLSIGRPIARHQVAPNARGAILCYQTPSRGSVTHIKHMKTYIVLVCYTEKGIKALKKDLLSRADVERLCRSCGVSLSKFHWVAGGTFDAVLICEAPDNRTLSGLFDRLGNCQIEALSVVSAAEFREVINDRPITKALRRLIGKRVR